MFDYQNLIIFTFILGYFLLICENKLHINKAAVALLTGITCWGLYFNLWPGGIVEKHSHLVDHIASITQILFFLLGAMTIVEIIASHQGFDFIRNIISHSTPRRLYWILLFMGFWMSSVLDNLTSIIVLASIIDQCVEDKKLRRLLCAGLVFVVNVGGAWSPIGDITTTMLWIQGRISTFPLVQSLFIPSFVSLLVFGVLFSFFIPKGKILKLKQSSASLEIPGTKRVLIIGALGLISVPFLKLLFNIPPFMGMLTSLSILWIVTDLLHKKSDERKVLRVDQILRKIDTTTVLFFLGVLLAVDALETTGILKELEVVTRKTFTNLYNFTLVVGFVSSIIDNVPLVAGIIKMFPTDVLPTNHTFWMQIAYTAGVGGSLLIIGSAPGIAVMALNNIHFFWYVKRVSWIALIAFISGWAIIVLQSYF